MATTFFGWIPIAILFPVCLICFVYCIGLAFRLLFEAKPRTPAVAQRLHGKWMAFLLPGLLLAFILLDAFEMLADPGETWDATHFGLLASLMGLISFVAVVGITSWYRQRRGLSTSIDRTGRWLVAGVLLVQSGWVSAWLVRMVEPEHVTPFGTVNPGLLIADPNEVGITDQGTKFPVFHWIMNRKAYAEYMKWSRHHLSGFLMQCIQREPPTSITNCHGWIFAQGRFVLKGNQIEAILKDNGYFEVPVPQPNDISVFRSATGAILHTGLVRGVLNDGTIMIESKWGADGRYLHPVDMQPYSNLYGFWRTERANHAVQTLISEEDS